jgi:hypothetical protein
MTSEIPKPVVSLTSSRKEINRCFERSELQAVQKRLTRFNEHSRRLVFVDCHLVRRSCSRLALSRRQCAAKAEEHCDRAQWLQRTRPGHKLTIDQHYQSRRSRPAKD